MSTSTRMRVFAFALAASGCLLMAQGSGGNSTQFSGPTLGFAPGGTPSQLQPILGIPGAARLGAPVSLPTAVTQVYLAPGHTFALAAQGASAPTALVMLRNTSGIVPHPALTPLTRALANPDLVAFSPIGQSAVLYSQASGRVQIYTGLPNTPRLAQDISNLPIADIRLLAVSDDAQLLVLADATSTVYALSPGAAAVPVYYSDQVSGLAFAPGSHEVIVCDLNLRTAAVLQPLTGQLTFAIALDSACRPRAAAVTRDGTILLACSLEGYVWAVDRQAGLINSYQVPAALTAFDKLGTADSFLLSPPDQGIYRMLTWQPGGAVVSFIGTQVPGAGN